MSLKRSLLLLPLLAACAAPSEERVGRTYAAFTSADAVLVELELDAKLIVPTTEPPEVRKLLETQLMYLVGQLNGERAVGRHDRLELTVATIKDVSVDAPRFEVSYHAKLPVAWGQASPPTSYSLTLPLEVDKAAQERFAAKYSSACTDPEGGVVEAGRMFLFFRPQRAGCTFSTEDIVTTTAAVHPSSENTTGKYPEYHRVWEDDALVAVAVFGRELYEESANDAGAHAYRSFVEQTMTYLRGLPPEQVELSQDASVPNENARMTAKFGKRKILIDAILVGPKVESEAAFDAWYDARTPKADVIVYSGHAGLGDNVRALSQKGTFEKGKYVISVVNGCDTFAYLDRTLADRRYAHNPDDYAGTKYMDTVANVLGGYFRSNDETSLHLIKGLVSGLDGQPKTYPQILEAIDKTQVMVVSGEEDNEFEPSMLSAKPNASPSDPPSVPSPRSSPSTPGSKSANASCELGAPLDGETDTALGTAVTLAALIALVRRRAGQRSKRADGSQRFAEARS